MHLSTGHQQAADRARRFASEQIRPRAERLGRLERLDRDGAFAADIYRAMGEWGLLGITVPQSDGGAGLGMPACALQRRIIARTSIDG
ncbi:acyl-CoA dehydrogenase family protein [Verminephrobacter eiseniae]|uniref:Isovaleryl-CoA dehydrogenase n=1 Tax=Verminephrobacter eiseniae (strain EF01-2) TaxID=391735 RepID=A1WG66_VEREI|nr:acyl-CoA dehydrogenase family protein [Verminephrobacter eiseniae]ABM56623.1 isovaleryl-CoA dehydrogenase [Verminephrobacter eiseniae EF01-2]MCW5286981.1 acyl-CoA dehydrogenase family protein [Verminephrobacter eiseniae]MCW5305279.1 acyl-CoA dehydrogenase family protein [Verminephrobacter eiseniae]MCW8179254.1 acyl-CoA dehydrogenase family protein [Verminephrobacter eiseniae]MCW8191666.1 acyl-CoA dehydrogenase family protein [Verminephrobacter eiseniae]